jgi:putative ABC transport system substrate-binding protein
MNRREFLGVLGGAAAAWPRRALAQQTKIPVIGFLSGRTPAASVISVAAFRQGMTELGYDEGKNYAVEFRYSEGQYELLPRLAEQLVAAKVDIIVALGSPSVRAAQRATSRIPIVIAGTGDAVQSGLVASLARPGGNTTGSSHLTSDVLARHVQLMVTILPNLSRIAILTNPGSATRKALLKSVAYAAKRKNAIVIAVDARNANELNSGFAKIKRERAQAVLIGGDSFLISQTEQIARLAADSMLPSSANWPEYAQAGGLFSYGPDIKDGYRRAATFVDKILKGAKPADLPIEQPTKFELIINRKTAKALGLEIPANLLFTADEVIE